MENINQQEKTIPERIKKDLKKFIGLDIHEAKKIIKTKKYSIQVARMDDSFYSVNQPLGKYQNILVNIDNGIITNATAI